MSYAGWKRAGSNARFGMQQGLPGSAQGSDDSVIKEGTSADFLIGKLPAIDPEVVRLEQIFGQGNLPSAIEPEKCKDNDLLRAYDRYGLADVPTWIALQKGHRSKRNESLIDTLGAYEQQNSVALAHGLAKHIMEDSEMIYGRIDTEDFNRTKLTYKFGHQENLPKDGKNRFITRGNQDADLYYPHLRSGARTKSGYYSGTNSYKYAIGGDVVPQRGRTI